MEQGEPTIPESTWTTEEVATWAQQHLKLSSTFAASMQKNKIDGDKLYEFSSDYPAFTKRFHFLPPESIATIWMIVKGRSHKRPISDTDFADRDGSKKAKMTTEADVLSTATQDKEPFMFVSGSTVTTQEEDFEFENREKELKEFVDICVFNAKIIRENKGDNTFKMRLPIASQMIGSGKTWFGRHAVLSLNRHKDKIKNSYQTNGEKETVEDLAKAHYVLIDMKKVSKPYSAAELRRSLLESLILSCTGEIQAEAKANWIGRDLLQHSIKSVATWFGAKLEVKLLFHFDEVDAIVDPVKAKDPLTPSIEQLNTYYNFWEHIFPLHSLGFIYCSGRSPQLYFIGRQKLVNPTGLSSRTSPGESRHIFFDRLLLNNIESMVTKFINKKKLFLSADFTPNEVAQIIYNYTAGIPRFVTYSLLYLASLSTEEAPLEKAKCTNDSLFFNELFNYVLHIGGEAELYSWRAYERIYSQLAIDAILAIPYTIEDVVSVAKTAFYKNVEGLEPKTEEAPDTEVHVQLLQLIWLIGAFTAKTPQYQITGDLGESLLEVDNQSRSNQLYIIVPPLVAFAISADRETKFVLTLAGLQGYSLNKSIPIPKGDLLEYIGKQCFTNRLCTKIANLARKPKLHDLFPFLRQTTFPNLTMESLGQPLCLPKFTHTKIINVTPDKAEKVKSLLHTKYEAELQVLEVPYTYWKTIVPHLQLGMYIPVSLSFSGDFYVVVPNSDPNQLSLLVVQYKAGDQKLTIRQLRKEIFKAFNHELTASSTTSNTKYVSNVVLVFVGGGTYDNIKQACEPLNEHAEKISYAKLLELDLADQMKTEAQRQEQMKKAEAKKLKQSNKKKQTSKKTKVKIDQDMAPAPTNKPQSSRRKSLITEEKLVEDEKVEAEDKQVVAEFQPIDDWPIPANAKLEVLKLTDLGLKQLLGHFNVSLTNQNQP